MAHAAVADFDEGQCVQFSEESHAIQAAIDGAGVTLASDVLVGQDPLLDAAFDEASSGK